MTATLNEANETMRAAVRARLESTPVDDPKLTGYKPTPLAGCKPAAECAAQVLSSALSSQTRVHASSQAFYELCDSIKAMHASKSRDYGSEHDPLANIRNGAAFVGIPAWKGAMVRLSDKVTRLATFNRTGTLTHEGVEDTLLDLASYSLLALLLYREEKDA